MDDSKISSITEFKNRVYSRGLKKFVDGFRKIKCLKCDRVDMKLSFNRETDRYEGRRLCKSCRQSHARKYMDSNNLVVLPGK